jgi:hypothetical protein
MVKIVGRLDLRCSCGPKLRVDVWDDMLVLVSATRDLFLRLHGYPGHHVAEKSRGQFRQQDGQS